MMPRGDEESFYSGLPVTSDKGMQGTRSNFREVDTNIWGGVMLWFLI